MLGSQTQSRIKLLTVSPFSSNILALPLLQPWQRLKAKSQIINSFPLFLFLSFSFEKLNSEYSSMSAPRKLCSKLEIWKQVMLISSLSLSSDVWMLPISWWQKQKAWNVVEKIALAVVLPYYQTSEYFLRFSREISPVCEFESRRQIAHPRPMKNKEKDKKKEGSHLNSLHFSPFAKIGCFVPLFGSWVSNMI